MLLKVSQNEYKDVLFRIQSKNHRIGTYEINKISLPCFGDKIYIPDNETDPLALHTSSYSL